MSDLQWPLEPLGKVLKYRKEFVTIDDTSDYKLCRVQWYGQGVILRKHVKGADVKTKQQQVCRTDDFLVAEIDAKEGGFGIVPEILDGAIVSSHYFLFTIDQTQLDTQYLRYAIRTPAFQAQVAAKGTTNYSAIRPHHVLDYMIPLPPPEEQRRIVARIDDLAAQIEEAHGLRQSITEETEAFIVSLHLKLSKNRIVTLGDILALDERVERIEPNEEYVLAGVYSFGKGLFSKGTIQGHATNYTHFNKLFIGAIVLSQLFGWEGAIAVCDERFDNCYVSKEFRTFNCLATEALPEYLAFVVPTKWFWSQLQRATKGMGNRRQRVKPDLLANLKLPMPPLETQKWAVNTLKNLHNFRTESNATLTELDRLLPSVLDRAFKGAL